MNFDEEGKAVGSPTFDESFELMFTELYALAKRPALRVLRDAAEAEDVAAETLARLYVRWSRLAERPNLGGWVVQVATNLSLDQLRRRQRQHLFLPDRAVSSDRDTQLDVATAIAKLPRRQRQVVSLKYFGDLPEADIAAVLSLGLPTVRTHLQRAKASLSPLLTSTEESLL